MFPTFADGGQMWATERTREKRMNTRTEGILRRPFGRLLIFALAARLAFEVMAAVLLMTAASVAQNQMTITATKIVNLSGAPLANGQACLLPTDNQGSPINFQMGGGGQGTRNEVCTSVANGVFSIMVPNVSLTNRTNVCLKLTVRDPKRDELLLNKGYECLQPQPSAYWCSGSLCNLDNYIPAGASNVQVIAGPPGAPGGTPAGNAGDVQINNGAGGLGALPQSSLVNTAGNQTVAGVKTFSNPPVVPTPIGSNDAANKAYVDSHSGGGGSGSVDLSSPGPIGATTPSSATFTDLKTGNTPHADIRKYGAVIDGATDIGAALTAATEAACTSGGTVYLPCGGTNGCYLANGANWFSGTSCQGRGVRFELQGLLKPQTTFVTPNDSSLVCIGGAGYTSAQVSKGPLCRIQAPNAHGTLGTTIASGTQTVTPTFTSGSVANLVVGSSITVMGASSCAISGNITRTTASSKNVTATVATPCRIPQGSLATLSGAADSSFNGSFMVLSINYQTGAIAWTQTGAGAATTTGGSVSGSNDDSFETVRIESVSGSTVTATFVHAHDSADKWGAVALAPMHDTYNAHHFEGLEVIGNYGAAFFAQHNFNLSLDSVHFSATAWPSSIAAELASSNQWQAHRSMFDSASQYQCVWNCSQTSYPRAIRLTSQTGTNDGVGLGIIDDRSWISGGIKVDTNQLTGLPSNFGVVQLRDSTVETPVGSAILVDPRTAGTNNQPFYVSNVLMQDNFPLYPQYLMSYTDPSIFGGLVVDKFNPINVDSLVNSNMRGSLVVDGVNEWYLTTALPSRGIVNDGKVLKGEMVGQQAGFSPSLIPHATKAVTTDPTAWSCTGGCTINTGLLGPDGLNNAAELVSSASNQSVEVYSASVTLAQKDWVISGVFVAPGTNTTEDYQASPFGAFSLYHSNASSTFDDTASNLVLSYNTGFAWKWRAGGWHSVVSANKVTGVGGSGSLTLALRAPSTTGQGTRFQQPFLIHVPYSEKPSHLTDAEWDAEILRWREQLMHGYVPAGLPSAALAINPGLKMYWGSDTNFYRSAAGVLQTDGDYAAKKFTAHSTPLTTDATCSAGNYWIAPIAGAVNKWRKCENGTLSDVGSGNGTSPLTTKGDLYSHSTADARLPVGTDGQCLVADSTQTLGLKWDACGNGTSGLTAVVSALSSDVTMTTAGTWYDGPSVALTAGTWDLHGKVTVEPPGGSRTIYCKLWDGTTAVDSSQGFAAATTPFSIALGGAVTLTGSATYKISCTDNAGSSVIKADMLANSAGLNASTLVAVAAGSGGGSGASPSGSDGDLQTKSGTGFGSVPQSTFATPASVTSAVDTETSRATTAEATKQAKITANNIVYCDSAGNCAAGTAAQIVALFGGGSCSGYLKNDGTCGTPSGGSPAGSDGDIQTKSGTGFGSIPQSTFATPASVTSAVAPKAPSTNPTLTVGQSLAAGTCSGFTSAIVGSGLTAGSVYYIKPDGTLDLAMADSLSTISPGMCMAATATQCMISGSTCRYAASQSWTPGQRIYLSDTSPGALTTTAPATAGHYLVEIGGAISDDTISINIMPPGVE
jgi:hypothetical protein